MVPVDVRYSAARFTMDGNFEPGARAPELIRSTRCGGRRTGQRQMRLDLIAVPGAVFLLGGVAGVGQVGDDAVGHAVR